MAEALRIALLELGPPGLRVAIDDPLQRGARPHAGLVLRGYGPVVRSAPGLWGLLFSTFARPAARGALESFLLSGLGQAMERTTAARRPRVVVNCHPLLGPAAARSALALRPAPKLVTMITDLTVVHPGWLSPRDAHFMTPSAVATRWCLDQGIQPDRVVEVGLPVDAGLLTGPQPGETRAGPRRDLGLAPGPPCLLLGGGGEGAGRLLPLVTALDGSGLEVQAVVLCGRNRRLLSSLRRRRWRIPLVALPYLEDPSPWLLASDIYIGKAGPSALAEAAASGLAMVVTDALPGQELANRQLLVESGAALSADSPGELVRLLGELCAGGGARLLEMQRRAVAWSRPGASALAAATVLKWL